MIPVPQLRIEFSEEVNARMDAVGDSQNGLRNLGRIDGCYQL